MTLYSLTCFQRPPKGSNKSCLLQLVVLKSKFYYADLRRGVVSEQWSLKTVKCLIQVSSNTGLIVLNPFPNTPF